MESRKRDEHDQRKPPVVRPDTPVPPGVYVDPWDEPLDPRIVEPAEPVEPRAPPAPGEPDDPPA